MKKHAIGIAALNALSIAGDDACNGGPVPLHRKQPELATAGPQERYQQPVVCSRWCQY